MARIGGARGPKRVAGANVASDRVADRLRDRLRDFGADVLASVAQFVGHGREAMGDGSCGLRSAARALLHHSSRRAATVDLSWHASDVDWSSRSRD